MTQHLRQTRKFVESKGLDIAIFLVFLLLFLSFVSLFAQSNLPRYKQFLQDEVSLPTLSVNTARMSLQNFVHIINQDNNLVFYVSPEIDIENTFSRPVSAENESVINILRKAFPQFHFEFRPPDEVYIVDKITRQIKIPTMSITSNYQSKVSSQADKGLSGAEIQVERRTGEFTGGAGSSSFSTSSGVWDGLEKALRSVVSNEGDFSIAPDINLITIRDRPYEVEKATELVKSVINDLTKQVIVSVFFVEVVLTENHARGIDWDKTINHITNANNKTSIVVGTSLQTTATSQSFILSATGNTISALFNLLDEYGKVKVLQKPVLAAINKIPVVITTGQSQAFISNVRVDVSAGGGGSVITQTPTIDEVKEGLTLSFVAEIQDDNSVLIDLVPVVSRVDKFTSFTFSNETFSAPVLSERALSSRVKLNKGQMLIIGGVMSKTSSQTKQGNDWMEKRIPFLSKLFSKRERQSEVSELVIILKVDDIENSDNIFETKDLVPQSGLKIFK